MPEPRRMTANLKLGARVAPDGTACVLLEWPDGSGLMLPPQQALSFAFGILGVAKNLFRNTAELEQAILAARVESEHLTGERPRVQ